MKKQRFIALFMSAALACSIFTGCGNNNNAPSKKTEATSSKKTSKKTEQVKTKDTENCEDFEWPNSENGKMLPETKSKFGWFYDDYKNGLSVNVANTSKQDFKEYVKKCKTAGFTENVTQNPTRYSAANKDHYKVSVVIDDDYMMSIKLTLPKDSDNLDQTTIRPEVKQVIDSYEQFINEYVEFMKQYNALEDTSAVDDQYMSYDSQYTEWTDKISTLRDAGLTDAEEQYYSEVEDRVLDKELEM